MSSNCDAYDTATAQALREVYDVAWSKRDEESKFYEEVIVPVPASSSSPSGDYMARFLRVGGIQYFTQLVRAENGIVLAAVNDAIGRYAAPAETWSHGSSVIVGQTGVGKSMCLRHALVERLLDCKQTIYLDEAAHVFVVYTASGCRVFGTIDPKGTLCDLSTGRSWKHLFDWAATAAEPANSDPVAADILHSDRVTTTALIDSDPARPHPPLWLVSPHSAWVNVQATSTPPLDYQLNNTWAYEERADTIWMDVWSWPEVYAACVHLYDFDAERLDRVHEVFVCATPTLEHCVEFSHSPSVIQMLRDWVRFCAKSFVASPNGVISRVLLRMHDLPEEPPLSCLASVDCLTAHSSWLFGVLDPKDCDNHHRGRAMSTSTTRVTRPYIMCPRRCDPVQGNVALRSVACVQIASVGAHEAIRLALVDEDMRVRRSKLIPQYKMLLYQDTV